MAINFKWLIDTQLPPKLVNLFTEFGQDAVHIRSYEDGIYMNDAVIRKIAINENRIIVTKDSDFYDGHFKNVIMPKILYLKIGNISNKNLFSILKNNLPSVIDAYNRQSKLIIIDNANVYFY